MARSFNGTSQYATATSSVNYNSTDITVSLWVYIPSTNNMSGGSHRIIEVGGLASTVLDGLSFELNTFTSAVGAKVWDGGNWVTDIGSAWTYTTNTWNHLAITARLTTSELNRFYANGAQQGADLTSGGRTANAQDFSLAAQNDGESGNYLNGNLAELSFFNVDLTASEISDLAAGRSPVAVNEAALVAYWRMDGAGATENDYVNSAVLTYTGSPGTATGPTVDDPPTGSDRAFNRFAFGGQAINRAANW